MHAVNGLTAGYVPFQLSVFMLFQPSLAADGIRQFLQFQCGLLARTSNRTSSRLSSAVRLPLLRQPFRICSHIDHGNGGATLQEGYQLE